jgi:uncharacterized protein (UPF0335 family)
MDWKELLFNELKDLRNNVDYRLKDIDEKQESMNLDLREHIRRTEQNEQMIRQITTELKPVKEHVDGLKYTSKLLKWVAGIVITLGSVIGAITKINGAW